MAPSPYGSGASQRSRRPPSSRSRSRRAPLTGWGAGGAPRDLAGVGGGLPSAGPGAGPPCALATPAVLLLARWGGPQGLGPLIDRLAGGPSLDAALRATYQVTEGDFAERWQRDVRSRYGWLSWAGAVGLFWAVTGSLLVWLVVLRRRRDRARRALLDEGWTVPSDEGPTA